MKRLSHGLMASNFALVTCALIALGIGIGLSLNFHNFQWLSRFGALVICFGVITLARYSFLGRQAILDVEMITGFSDLDPRHYEVLGEPLPDWFEEEMQAKSAIGWIGPLLCFIGTVTNGFADLLTKLVWP